MPDYCTAALFFIIQCFTCPGTQKICHHSTQPPFISSIQTTLENGLDTLFIYPFTLFPADSEFHLWLALHAVPLFLL